MAASDLIALNHNFAQWQKTRGAGLVGIKPFNYYVVENFLKPFPVNDKEIMAGAVDQTLDGGVDAFYFFANRKYVHDDTELDPDSEYRFNLVIFQCKEGAGFSPVEMGKFVFFADDLLDLNRDDANYKAIYHTKLRGLMKKFKDQFSHVAGSVISVEIEFIYVSKLDVEEPIDDGDVKTYERRLSKEVAKHFPKAIFKINYVNAAKLLAQVQLRKQKTKSLSYAGQTLQTAEGWVVLAKLPDYYKFLQDDHGNFQEEMLEENVRGFQKKTSVNDSIRKTLNSPSESAEFWLLNNGITILTDELTPAGHGTLRIKGPQIVNGLQSSRHIFDYYNTSGIPSEDKRKILVRIIETSDEAVRDQIISATNSQNKMPPEALRATDPIQRKIEEVFAGYGLFYDRRKGHYKDQGKPAAKIVSVREVLQATLAVALRRPDDARARPADYLNEDDKYNEVYGNDKIPILSIVRSTEIVRRIEAHKLKAAHEPYSLNLLFYAALNVAARVLGNAHIPPQSLATLSVAKIDESVIAKSYDDAYAAFVKAGGNDNAAKGSEMRNILISKIEKDIHGKKK